MGDRLRRVRRKGMTPSRQLRASLPPSAFSDDESLDGEGDDQTHEHANEGGTDWFHYWDEVFLSELMLLTMMFYHLFEASGTKEQESFNMQATHDFIYHGWNVTWYNLLSTVHQLAPGTYAGALYLSLFGIPANCIFSLFNLPKHTMQLFVRFVLGCTVIAVFSKFARAVSRKFDKETGMILRVITLCQFNFLFNASRLFSDTFALILVLMVYERCISDEFYMALRWATAATILFRTKLILLFVPMFFFVHFHGKIKLFGRQEQSVFSVILQIVIPIAMVEILGHGLKQESFLHLVNDVQPETWVHQFHWYLADALPSCLLTTILPCCMGFFFDAKMSSVFWIVLIFFGGCSLISSKDIRIVTYIVPLLNLVAATFMAQMRSKGVHRCVCRLLYYFLSALSLVNLYISLIMLASTRREYPGWYSLGYIQYYHSYDAQRNMSVYIDSACFQTGATSFAQFQSWEYNSTKFLTVQDLERFDIILTGIHGSELYQKLSEFQPSHYLQHIQYGFHNVSIEFGSEFPYFRPRLNLMEQVAIFVKKVDL